MTTPLVSARCQRGPPARDASHTTNIASNPDRHVDLAQRAADLDRGYDAIVQKDEPPFAVDISLANAPCRLATINAIRLAPARCFQTLARHADPRLATTYAVCGRLHRVNLCG